MKALILNNEVVEVQATEFEVAPTMSWVDCDDTVKEGFTYDGTNFTDPFVEPTDAEKLKSLRTIRDGKLKICDWTVGVDSPLSDSDKTSWTTYRQALRDITNTYTNLTDVVWPTEPTE